ncbi:hypothetical protein Fmac_025443 [Flemingia macrophylla]|uniref:Uncharacterized protein n=1 Tax=Flemingia macrophylla TaxID=520843 RepID=A0ABD1LS81_9FABA
MGRGGGGRGVVVVVSRLVEELQESKSRLKTEMLEHKLLRSPSPSCPTILESEISAKESEIERNKRRVEKAEAENERLMKKLQKLKLQAEESKRKMKMLEDEVAELKRSGSRSFIKAGGGFFGEVTKLPLI